MSKHQRKAGFILPRLLCVVGVIRQQWRRSTTSFKAASSFVVLDMTGATIARTVRRYRIDARGRVEPSVLQHCRFQAKDHSKDGRRRADVLVTDAEALAPTTSSSRTDAEALAPRTSSSRTLLIRRPLPLRCERLEQRLTPE